MHRKTLILDEKVSGHSDMEVVSLVKKTRGVSAARFRIVNAKTSVRRRLSVRYL
jgi:hypothetical protein